MEISELRSGAEPLAAMRAPLVQHRAAALARHAGAEAVAALAHQFARLIGPLHGSYLRSPLRAAEACRAASMLPLAPENRRRVRSPPLKLPRLIGEAELARQCKRPPPDYGR